MKVDMWHQKDNQDSAQAKSHLLNIPGLKTDSSLINHRK